MKKSIKFLGPFVFLVFLAFTGCQKETIGTTTFEATMEECQDDDGKTAFTNGTMNWVNGDQIKVFGSAGSGVYQATVHGSRNTTFNLVSGNPGGGPYIAVYPASAAIEYGVVELPVVQVTVDGSLRCLPMCAESNGNRLDFKNWCGVLRMRLQKSGVSVKAIEVTGDIDVTGDYYYGLNIAENGPALAYIRLTTGTNTIMMTCATPQSIESQKDFYLFLPPHEYSNGMRIRIYSSDGGVCTKTVTVGHSVRIQRGKITTITLRDNSLTFVPNAGALPGLFTINENGDQVRFSQGNLQYTTLGTHAGALGSNMPGIWRFAPEQYEYVGKANANISDTNPNWIDLFGWGTGINPTLHSENDYDYQTFVDWGTNVVCNGGSQPETWRTLTLPEWEYLFMTRVNASDKFGTGNVNGIRGIIILPDSWTLPSGCSFTAGVADNYNDWSLNGYTMTQWAEMEAAGAVFLPDAGERSGNYVWDNFVAYWSYSPLDYLDDWIFSGYVYSHANNVSICPCCIRIHKGLSVRLVRDNNSD